MPRRRILNWYCLEPLSLVYNHSDYIYILSEYWACPADVAETIYMSLSLLLVLYSMWRTKGLERDKAQLAHLDGQSSP